MSFGKEHKAKLAHTEELIGRAMWLSIHVTTRLITALKTAVDNGKGSLDKDATCHDDLSEQ